MRRQILGFALLLLSSSTAFAQISDNVVRIGLLTDFSSVARDNTGPGSLEAARLAIEDFGPTVDGKKIELIYADHQNKADVGLQIARQWIDEDKVDAILDVANSAIAIGVQNLTREKKRVLLLSGGASSVLTDAICSPYTAQFAFDSYSLSKAIVSSIVKNGGKTWFFITVDYAFGAALQADATRFINEAGGTVIGGVRHPLGTTDFASFLIQAQNSHADVVAFANAGADTTNALKQASEFGLTNGKQQIVSLLMFVTDVKGVGLKDAQGIYFATSSYWDMNDGTRAWTKRFMAVRDTIPTMIHTGVYSAVLHYLQAVQAAKSDDADKVMAKMRELPINDVFIKNGWLRKDGRVIRDMYVAHVKTPSESKGPYDLVDIVRTVKGEDAFRPVSESKCPLLKP
jgi:branched-chain amino acid transport system substrate-binding protein